MNKTAIKNFAVWARRKLISEITYKAGLLGITGKVISDPLPQSTKDLQFFDVGTKDYTSVSGNEIKQRNALISHIKEKERSSDYKTAFQSVVEEVSYTWFNRLIAIRFMEVNDYLPSRIRVLSSDNSAKLEPDFVTNPFDTDLAFSAYERDRVMQLKDENKLDELFRMLFIMQCNKLNDNLPELFEKTDDYTELLLTISFTDKDGVVSHLVHDIDEDDFNVEKEGQVEIIGWLYQFYNSEPKDEVFALLKKNVKITKERIPAATQLFTPDWIVRYMVENSLGRTFVEWSLKSGEWSKKERIEKEKEIVQKMGWKYYLPEAEQTEEVRKQLHSQLLTLQTDFNIENFKVIDPCMGSGHILVYAFDVLMQIYESAGFTQRDAAALIVEKNLCGLDIDDRAYQLAYFAVMMKGRQYDRRFLTKEITPNLHAFKNVELHRAMCNDENEETLDYLLHTFIDAKEYGSIINVDYPLEKLITYRNYILNLDENGVNQNGDYYLLDEKEALIKTKEEILPILDLAIVLAQKYDVVVTNPPYMGSSGLGVKLTEYVNKNYPNSKSDLYACFIEKCCSITGLNGKIAMVTMHSWMFLSSFEKLRENILYSKNIESILHLGMEAFDEIIGKVVSTVSFILTNINISDYKFRSVRLVDFYDSRRHLKSQEFFSDYNRYIAKKEAFFKIPGMPFAYWWNDKIIQCFKDNTFIPGNPMKGIQTGNGEKYLRLWFEVSLIKTGFDISSHNKMVNSYLKWFPLTSGGTYRKWYGNYENVVNLENNGSAIRATGLKNFRLKDPQFYFLEGLTWTEVTTKAFTCRFLPSTILFGNGGPVAFFENNKLLYTIGLLNSVVASQLFSVLAPTLNYGPDQVRNIPFKTRNEEVVENFVIENINISKVDWDSLETSWGFKKHPLVIGVYKLSLENSLAEKYIESNFLEWERFTGKQFNQLKANEEELNRIFIEIYGLQDELTPEVEEKDITIRKADLGRDIRSFISYAAGCMFGRYSLDVEGLAFAGGDWDEKFITTRQDNIKSTFTLPMVLTTRGITHINVNGENIPLTYIPDADNCIPITDEEYFADDIVGRFVEFVRVVYGKETLEENLDFIATALGNKGNTSHEVIRNYFIKDFYKDHCKIYQKRPIYWLFESGKEDGFKALIYMHRYNADTIGTMRIEYLHRMQKVYESEISRMQETIDNSTNVREVAAAEKRKEKLIKQLKETKDYDAKIAHLALARIEIDLDDGVKVNYEKVQTGTDGKKLEVLGKI